MKHIIFCLPGAPTLAAAMSWDVLVAAASKPERGLRLEVARGYNASVAHCRNDILENGVSGPRKHAKPFGGKAYDFMMWIDDDSVYTPEDFFRLLEADRDIISGMVPMNPEGAGAFGLVEGAVSKYVNLHAVRQDEPMRDWHFCGFGFLMVRHGVFESLDYPWFREVPYEVEGHVVLPGEDIDWCRRIREKGFKLWAHPAVRIGHDKRNVIHIPGPAPERKTLLDRFIDRYDHAWRMSAPALQALREILDERKPKKVLELGPGASTFVVLPWCLEHGSLYRALDHVGPYSEKHLDNLREAELTRRGSFVVPLAADGGWYKRIPLDIEQEAPYDLVIVDGPVEGRGCPEALAAYERWSNRETVWVFDDVHRETEELVCGRVQMMRGKPWLRAFLIRDPDYPRETVLLRQALDGEHAVSHTEGQNQDAEAVGPTASQGQPEAIA